MSIGLLAWVAGLFLLPAAAHAAPPSACFTVTPASPLTNETTTLDSSCSTDDGEITGRTWDLDNDGQFDDGTATVVTRTWSTPGTYTVRLAVSDRGTTDIETKTITVRNRAPVANFSISPANPNTGTPVTFTSTSSDADGTIASQRWALDADGAFNDGTGTSVTRTFTTPGDYSVKLEVTDSSGGVSTVTKTVTVANRAPTAGFTFSPATPTRGQSITFTSTSVDPDGTIAAQAWDTDGDASVDFNDGTGTTATRSFASAGTYTIRLQVTDDKGATSVTTRSVTVGNNPPLADFTFSPSTPTTASTITFTSASSDADGTIASHAWDSDGDAITDFNDGTGTTTSRSFSTSGSYPIRLRVVDNEGAVSVVTKTVTVGNQSPSSAFTVSPSNPLSHDEITFTSTAADPDGTIARYEWDTDGDAVADFNDGTSPTATKTWGTPGDRVVRLRVTDNKGAWTIGTMTVSVGNRAPLASFTIAPESIVEGETVTLSSTSSDRDGTIGDPAWDLDNDGAYDDAAGSNTSFTAGAPGPYTVGLRVVDDQGAAHSTAQTYIVGERPATLPEERTDPGSGTFDISAPSGSTPSPAEPSAPDLVAPLRYLDPFPVIRMRGRTTGRGAKLSVFTVRAPHGSLAELRCSGRGCTVKKTSKRIRSKRRRGSAMVHFPQVERFLPGGTVLQVRVTQGGMIGKYTRIKVRRVALPIRSDRCLLPDSSTPAACPQLP